MCMQTPSPFQMQPESREWQAPGEAVHADEDSGDSRPQPVLNVVVCGALMSAFEMSCQWDKVGKHAGACVAFVLPVSVQLPCM